MSFDWHEYWEFAEECQLKAPTMVSNDAALRASISRAYYSVFCRARNLVKARGIYVPTSGKAHIVVMDYFKHSSNFQEQQVGTELDRLRKKRNNADYDNVFPANLAKTAHSVVAGSKHAHAIIATLP